MNIRVHPAVRCSFIAEENVVRIVLKEAVGGSSSSAEEESSESQAGTVQSENKNQEVVVYALKVHTSRNFTVSLVLIGS